MAYESARWRDDPGAIGAWCNRCIHRRVDKKTKRLYCDAFPEGLNKSNIVFQDKDAPKVCNNGIGFEEKPGLPYPPYQRKQ